MPKEIIPPEVSPEKKKLVITIPDLKNLNWQKVAKPAVIVIIVGMIVGVGYFILKDLNILPFKVSADRVFIELIAQNDNGETNTIFEGNITGLSVQEISMINNLATRVMYLECLVNPNLGQCARFDNLPTSQVQQPVPTPTPEQQAE